MVPGNESYYNIVLVALFEIHIFRKPQALFMIKTFLILIIFLVKTNVHFKTIQEVIKIKHSNKL